MFGNLVGYGEYGFVYEDETEINGPDGSVVKILNLNNPCNLQQYNMFIQLQNHQDQGLRTPGLPFVFQTFRGIMTPNILNILSYATTDGEARQRLRSTLPTGSEYGIINMERLPCVAQNQFCGRNLKDKGNQIEEQSIYEAMVTYLYDSGWWVRDVIDPRNLGYNIHGEPVWFDPMVARRQGFPGFSMKALEKCHEEVLAYPSSYRKAIESGKYFTERHGYGLFNSEEAEVFAAAYQPTQTLNDYTTQDLMTSSAITGDYTTDSLKYGFGPTALAAEEIVCPNCDWSWQRSEGGDDLFTCHKCGFDNETYHSEELTEEVNAKREELMNTGRHKIPYAKFIIDREYPMAINLSRANKMFRLRDLFGSDHGAESFVSQDYPQCYLCGLPAKLDVMTAIGRRQFCGNRCRGEYEGIDYGEYPSEELEHELEIVEYYPGYKEWDYQQDSTIDIRCLHCVWRTKQIHEEPTHTWDSYKQSFYGIHPTNTVPVFDEDGDLEGYEECKHDMFIIKYLGREEYEDTHNPRAGNIVIGCRKCSFKDTLDHVDLPSGCSNRGRDKPLNLSQYFGSEYDWDDITWTSTDSPPPYEDWGIDWEDNYRSATGIFYSPAGRIGLQLRSQLVLSPNTWSGISGFLDAGESPYDAVVREIHEESGLPVDQITSWKYKVIWDNGSHRTYLFYVDTEFQPEVNEFKWEWDDWRWATLDTWTQVPNLHPGMAAALELSQ